METITPQTETKAIKEHKCNFCNLKINKGSIYLKAVYIYDDIYTWKSHIHCQQIADKLAMIDYCDEGITDDDFRECINNEFNELFNHNLNSFEERIELVLNHYGLTPNSK